MVEALQQLQEALVKATGVEETGGATWAVDDFLRRSPVCNLSV